MIKKTISLSMIFFILISNLIPYISLADERPSDVTVVKDTETAKKQALLGTTSEQARKENILGLSSYFSLFTKEDITVTKADAEGRIAAGGTITSTAPHPYHAGTEVENDNLAKIIAQEGISDNLELLYTTHATAENNETYDNEKKKIAVVGTEASEMTWSTFSKAQRDQIVAANLIDFKEEFEFLQSQSDYLNGLEVNGKIIKYECYSFTDHLVYGNRMRTATICRGTDEKINVFKMTVDEYNELFDGGKGRIYGGNTSIGNIFFDVPKDSYIVINIVGTGNVQFYINPYNNHQTDWNYFPNIYFPAYDEEISALNTTKSMYSGDPGEVKIAGETIHYVYDGNDIVRNENKTPQPFKLIFGEGAVTELQHSPDAQKYSKYIMYNMPQAQNFKIGGSMIGSILAPRAEGTDTASGYILGNIACKSYTGGIQFGHMPFDGKLDLEYDVKISKFDLEAEKNIADVQMQIMDLDGNIIKSWTTDENISTIKLKNGEYILQEIKTSNNYENPVLKNIGFRVSGYRYNGENIYTLELTANQTETKLIKKSQSLGEGDTAIETIRLWENLYSNIGLKNVLGNRLVQELEFSIASNIKEELYYIVASNGGGINFDNSNRVNMYNEVDWIEFKKWTNTKDGINSKAPIVAAVYNNGSYNGTLADGSLPGFRIHFYTSDGIEVTDQVTITNIDAVWYEPGETTTTTYTAASNVTLNEEADTLIVTNDHIKTTIELSKVDKDEPTKLLSGAVYELQDKEGTVLNTFAATETDGKSTLEDLSLDVGTYYLVEKTAPEGYKVSEEKIEVTVKPHTSETITKTVEDEVITVDVEKQDEYGNKLGGAKLQVLDKNKAVVATFESTEEIKQIKKLATGTYTLHEEYAPKGFEKAQDIEFTITPQGKI